MIDSTHGTETAVRQLSASFEIVFGTSPALVARAPGRVNLIGDHTDYNDGYVLPITIDRSAYAVVRPREDHRVSLYSVAFDEHVRYSLDAPPNTRRGGWESYLIGAIEELRRRSLLNHGVDVLVDGDVPVGAGLSSSAALVMAVLHALDVLFELALDPIETARIGQFVEHSYAGVQCGIMDQFVSRLGRDGSALLLDCRSLEFEYVPLAPGDLKLLITHTHVSRELASTAYGLRRSACERAVAAMQSYHPEVKSLRDVTPTMLESRREQLDPTLYRRVRHVVEENERVLRAADALRKGGFDTFGSLMRASHRSLRDLFEVSCPELDTLAATAWELKGVLGARMTGGGFGGCTVSLVEADALEEVQQALLAAYRSAHAHTPTFYVVRSHHNTAVLT